MIRQLFAEIMTFEQFQHLITHFSKHSLLKYMNSYILVIFLTLLCLSQGLELPKCTANCTVTNCAQCGNATCSACLAGYSLSLNSCTINSCSVPACQLCDTHGACIKCTDPYSTYNSSTASCVQQCSVSNCSKCKSGSTFCQECSSGYARYQWNDQCIPTLIANCQVIYDFQQQQFLCSKCTSGYKPTTDGTECMIENTNCTDIADCIQCSSSTICITCRIGYTPSNDTTTCIPNSCHISNCLYCAADGTCLKCFSNHTLSNNTCSIAACSIPNCNTCKPNSQFCDVCQNGFMLNIWTRQCENHSINVTNCLSFMIDPSNQLKCVQCGLGLVPSGDQLSCVTNCPPGCFNCTSSSNCSQCSPGYSMNQGNCTINNCTTSNCLLCAANQTCLQCDSYSNLINGACTLTCSISSCDLCKHNSAECQMCTSGFALNSWTKKCIPSPIDGCQNVLDYSQQEYLCTKCSHDLIPTDDQLACVPECAVHNCLSCNATVCLSCRPGYQLTQQTCTKNTCTVSNCLLCDSNKNCIKCSSNYTLSSGQCSIASCSLTNCQTCKIGSIFCDVCSAGYVLNIWLGVCQQLVYQITNCLAFHKDPSNQNRCVQCSNQLVPSSDGFSCVVNCPSHCSACSNGKCTTCIQGYYVSNGNCLPYNCSSDCQVCDSTGACLTCLNPGQSYNSGLKLCQSSCSLPNCASCLPNSKICSKCATGYALYDWNGQCRPSLISNCQIVFDFRGQQYLCSKCSTGYTPTADQSQCMQDHCSLIQNCQVCSTSSSCSSCRVGYSLTVNQAVCTPNSCTVSNCLYCNPSGSCLRCSSSFLLVNGQCQSAYCNIPFCSSCKQQSQFCDTCMSGYTWNIWTNQCQTSIISNCESQGTVNRIDYQCANCPANQTCTQCNFAYTYNSTTNSCTSSCHISNCIKCMNSQYCSQCAADYVLDASFLSCKPKCKITNCSKCATSISICDKCSAGFVLINNNCQADVCTIDNCLNCASSATCASCAPMFTLAENGTCVSICPIPNCRVCSSYITCDTCNPGYAPISSYQCSPACSITNCLLCADASTCSVCGDGYTLSTSGSACNVKCLTSNCAQCWNLDNCTTCAAGFTRVVNDFGKGICIANACPLGFYPNAGNTSQCLSCSLTGCDLCSTASTCSQCKQTYYLSSTTCTACSATYSNCLICSSSSCLQCQSGYALNSQNACVLKGNCSLGCITCPGGTCSQCSAAYYLNSSKLCSPKCTSGVYTSSGCSCSAGFYLANGACTACRDTKCTSCDQIKCLKCIAGYYPLLDTCVQCLPNCESCSSGAICDKCNFGYTFADFTCKFNYLNPNSTNQCPFGCSDCTFINHIPYCTKLSDGFAFGFNSSIIQCSPSCKTCASDNANLCLSCYSGVLNAGTCGSCSDQNCQSCSQDQSFCSNCYPAFTLKQGACVACSNNCLKCSLQGPGLCDDGGCISGFTALAYTHQCVKCLNGCTSCSNIDFTLCLTCSQGTYLSNGACISCPTSCSTCYSQSTCIQCRQGYSLNNGSCYLIPEFPCKQVNANNVCTGCIDNYQLVNSTCKIIASSICTHNCTQCPFGYYLTNSICQSCPNIANCLQCDSLNPSICLKCISGFYSNGISCLTCGSNCQLCSGPSRCFSAKTGYYLTKDALNTLTGGVSKCKSTCATCSEDNHCTSCPNNWQLVGLQCVSPQSFNVSIVIVPTSISWNETWSPAVQQSNAIKNWPQIYAKIQSLLLLNSNDNGVIMTRSLVCGSINATFGRLIGANENAATVRASLTSSLQAGTPGLSVLSTNLVTQNNDNNSSSSNVPLIVGLIVGIGGAIIIAIIIVLCYIYRKRQIEPIQNQQDKNNIAIEPETPNDPKYDFLELKPEAPSDSLGFDITKMRETMTPLKEKYQYQSKNEDKRGGQKNFSEVNLTEDNQNTNNKLMTQYQLANSKDTRITNKHLPKIQNNKSPANSRIVLIEAESEKKMAFDSSRVEKMFDKAGQLQSIQESERIKAEENLGDMEVEFNINAKDFE